jgi:16S rRNA (cytosine1402-N4)-methyltransferase
LKTDHIHCPVLVDEVIEGLAVSTGKTYWDGTLGTGGHSEAILQSSSPAGKVVGSDQDMHAIEIANGRLDSFQERFNSVHANFCDTKKMIAANRNQGFDGVVLDLGLSNLQLKQEKRGFSFLNDEDLDMRMDQGSSVSAYDIVNTWKEEDLSRLIWEYGEERKSRGIARKICEGRQREAIQTTHQLAALISFVFPPAQRYGRLHPATRTFQALRIAVNRELEVLTDFLNQDGSMLNPGGRLAIISYHSLEDRLVKHAFRRYAQEGLGRLIVKRPLTPSEDEIQNNPKSRSAKLRIFERGQ